MNEIALLGGFNHRVLGDGYVYNIKNNSVEQVIFESDNSFENNFKFGNTLNQTISASSVSPGKIAGLVADGNKGIHFITYTRGESQVKIILPREHWSTKYPTIQNHTRFIAKNG